MSFFFRVKFRDRHIDTNAEAHREKEMHAQRERVHVHTGGDGQTWRDTERQTYTQRGTENRGREEDRDGQTEPVTERQPDSVKKTEWVGGWGTGGHLKEGPEGRLVTEVGEGGTAIERQGRGLGGGIGKQEEEGRGGGTEGGMEGHTHKMHRERRGADTHAHR